MTREERKAGLRGLAERILGIKNKDELVVIYPHVRADGDAYGSSFALVECLKLLGIHSLVLLEEDISSDMIFLPNIEHSFVWGNLSQIEQEMILQKQSIAIQVDASEDSRFANRQVAYYSAETKLIIDHHISDKENNDSIFIDHTAGANVELIYTLILVLEELAEEELRNDNFALCIYTGLLTDTGSFSYNNTSSETLKIASELLEYDIDIAKLNNDLFKEKLWETLKVEAKLIEQAKLDLEKKISYLIINPESTKKLKIDDEQLSALPAKLRDVKGVLVSLMLREVIPNQIRGNLRSVGDIDISSVAKKYGGGGHKNAAGFTINDYKGDIYILAEKIIEDINLIIK